MPPSCTGMLELQIGGVRARARRTRGLAKMRPRPGAPRASGVEERARVVDATISAGFSGGWWWSQGRASNSAAYAASSARIFVYRPHKEAIHFFQMAGRISHSLRLAQEPPLSTRPSPGSAISQPSLAWLPIRPSALPQPVALSLAHASRLPEYARLVDHGASRHIAFRHGRAAGRSTAR